MSCAFGFDVGSKLIGVAVGNCITCRAHGLSVLGIRAGCPDWYTLDKLQHQWSPETLIVGLPLTLDDAEQPASHRARCFAAQLEKRYVLPVLMVDERHSSQEAARRFAKARASGLKRRHDLEYIDAEAAAVILERWLSGTAIPISPHLPGPP